MASLGLKASNAWGHEGHRRESNVSKPKKRHDSLESDSSAGVWRASVPEGVDVRFNLLNVDLVQLRSLHQ
ncbi:hypothetical protein L596_018748 [Steinernema carpocapsae]|uniref:Uncharacterized protein n=1 Tax=Steinernema carpocapsae TaxID=34508 RepID=A0A4U5N5K1_STECR|nr:hypothetical protein L596_018748 [Steinernema carpocapsae]